MYGHILSCSANVLRMKDAWFDRFLEAVQADPRGMRQISLDAGCGVNYVQQLVKNRKQPTVSRFASVLDVLGSAASTYVITGITISQEEQAILSLWRRLDKKARTDLGGLLSALEGRAQS